jgi:hypothetical protein
MSKKVVWVLGSGFSKSLGGPLLADLLSDRSGREARLRLKETTATAEPPRDYEQVYKVFAEHQRDNEKSKGLTPHWDHAEEFLTFVDSAEQNAVRKVLLKGWLPGDQHGDDDVTNFRRNAVQAVASECHFLYAASVHDDESWLPYIRWGNERAVDTDTIVTFNYDLVLEKLGQSGIVPPIGRGGVLTPDAKPPQVANVPIFKLHGSVDWFDDEYGDYSRRTDFVVAVKKGLTPLIGTPGMSKRKVKKRLAPLWEASQKALQRADVVVFLGYRSPPSDPDARAFILDAISTIEGVNGAPKHRRVHLVLGPNTNDPAVARMEKLVQFTMEASGRIRRGKLGHSDEASRYEVIKQPLYVEDFLSVYHDGELYGD